MSNDQDDSNPMHRIGQGRGDDVPRSRRTAAYAFVAPQDKKVEPTQPMEAVRTLTVKDVISKLIEVNATAWAALPQSMKDALIERPQDFQFINPGAGSTVNILYNGVVLRYSGASSISAWVVDKIVR